MFTHFLLEGLQGAASNSNGEVSVLRLFAHANEQTIKFTKGAQTPMFLPGGEMGDFIIAKVERPALKPELPTIRIEDITGKISWGEIEIPPSESIVVEHLTLPPIPDEILRTRIEIGLMKEAIQQIENDTHPALQQSQQAVKDAKEVYEQAEKSYTEIDKQRVASWKPLPKETQDKLMAAIMENPELKLTAVRKLCPNGVKYVDFANMVKEGKRVQPARKEYFRVKGEYEKIRSQAESTKATALDDLKSQLAAKEKQLPELISQFRTKVFLVLMSSCPGYADVNAEFPFDELVVLVPAMEQYEFGWDQNELLDTYAEPVWEKDRPCFEEARKKAEEEFKKNDPDRKAGVRQTLTVDGIKYAFRWCPAGKFKMGSPEDEEGRFDNEAQHEVTLTQGFWMMETEVTQAMWQSVMGNNPSRFKGDDLPVEKVSWDDCQAFCKKLTSKIGMKITLPTEAQWEYACRAGTTGPYAGELDKMAWYGYEQCGKTTHPVGQKQANAWGLYDMHGNVWEWCQDWYGDYPTGSVEDPTGPNSGSNRVDRGGGWDYGAQSCRSADRNGDSAGNRSLSLGFRAVGCPSR